ncbi:MAG: Crp/Fnr family transcriptional regulator [Hyphomicrobiaceae bacterium]|nr:Crp/Fnr family transcriptional regulator [Hyphomicrobiaceae bacterium]
MSESAEQIPGLDLAAKSLVAAKGMWITAPRGTRVFEPGKQCGLFYLLTRGVIRVQIVAESGREIVLYRVGPGEACVMTVSCLMGHSLYNGEGIVEEPLAGYAIGLPLFNELMSTSPHFRNTILSDYSERFLDLVNVLENVAFRPLESRLAARLLLLGEQEGCIECTHQFLATDLGSAREVISRLLKRWEERGLIHLERGKIILLLTDKLRGIV